jgi:hypothetical protein
MKSIKKILSIIYDSFIDAINIFANAGLIALGISSAILISKLWSIPIFVGICAIVMLKKINKYEQNVNNEK